MNLDFHWVYGDYTRGIWPLCSTEDSEHGDLGSSGEPWDPSPHYQMGSSRGD